MEKVTYEDVQFDRKNSSNKMSAFRHYCRLVETCNCCDKRIKFICILKDKLEELQNKIIEKL